MSVQSNNQGRAYEYICLTTLCSEISKFRNVEIEQNSAYNAAYHAWSQVGQVFQNILIDSAKSAVATIFDMEPMIIEKSNDLLKLKIQTDSEGKDGDVRDIVIRRKDVQWEIGLSIKHNHFAVKHSRLAKSLDFGQKWFCMPCSESYWNEIKPIFDYLKEQKDKHKNWSDLPYKDRDVYVPLLQAFMNEIRHSNALNGEVTKRMVEYLLGEFDFYKVISIDTKRITQIQTYNLHGTLNQANRNLRSSKKSAIAISNVLFDIINSFNNGQDELNIMTALQQKFNILIDKPMEDSASGKRSELKSSAFITVSFPNIIKCNICGGAIHTNSISLDHIIRKREDGKDELSNVQLTHPYCNTGYKN